MTSPATGGARVIRISDHLAKQQPGLSERNLDEVQARMRLDLLCSGDMRYLLKVNQKQALRMLGAISVLQLALIEKIDPSALAELQEDT